MSENLDLVRSLYADLERGDIGRAFQTASEWTHREFDDERVLVLEHRRGRGKGSGVETQTKAAGVVHFRDGKVTRLVMYWDREHALADLGLAPEGDTSVTASSNLDLVRSIYADWAGSQE